jgi:hypothetical protein
MIQLKHIVQLLRPAAFPPRCLEWQGAGEARVTPGGDIFILNLIHLEEGLKGQKGKLRPAAFPPPLP